MTLRRVLVEMSVMEQRYRAVQDVVAGSTVTDVAERFGVSRQAVHRWLAWYEQEGLEGLADRSSRPRSSPGQTSPEVEALICELRRNHPRWGARRLLYELGRRDCPGPIPSRITVHRVLIRHGLIDPTPRRRRREDYRRWERGRPMELWQMDIVGGIHLADGGEAKVVTGVDDHSRFCVIAAVVRRATGRAVCLAFAEALQRFGVPEEVLTDNGKQFTARFGRGGGEVMFDRICRENGIIHRLTKPRSPTTTGKVERFHQTLQRELLDDVEVWSDPEEAQAAIDVFRHEYNNERPHQSLGMAVPADRFTTQPAEEKIPLRLPPPLTTIPAPRTPPLAPPPTSPSAARSATAAAAPSATGDDVGLAVEVTRLVPASGNLTVCGQQFWLSPTRAGLPVTLWADTTVVHLLIDGVRLKTVPSRLTPNHLRQLRADNGQPAGPPPITTGTVRSGAPIEVERLVNATGLISLAGRQHPVGYHFAGRRVTVRLDRGLLQITADGVLLRSLPNPLTPAETASIRDARPAGPPPTPNPQPVRVERRVSCRGALVIAGQRIHVGIAHAGRTLTVEAADTSFRVHDGDQLLTEVPRTTVKPIARFKVRKPEPPRQQTDGQVESEYAR
ncbi:transposase InsO family protein [Micromonospora taraxaci]|uniref:Transposase InsO family protein n=2 Tax=Micromonospora taraxaci TaxID=1316803 RepID=A0A561W3B5_9ACTN|nr:transposase InsO family protein [Micromonospora taraxaci]